MDIMLDDVHNTSLTNATGYTFKILFINQRAHHIAEKKRRLCSSDLLLAITAKTPASNGKISFHPAKVTSEKLIIATIKVAKQIRLDTHVHFPFIE